LSYNFNKKWFVVASVFFVGERKDLQINQDIVYIKTPDPIVLKSYFDANCSLGYKHSERLTAYLKLNNIANQQYQKWLNYQVQGFQFLIGAAYKFDF
jgi:outer membrane receptor protein involved in Fe transport